MVQTFSANDCLRRRRASKNISYPGTSSDGNRNLLAQSRLGVVYRKPLTMHDIAPGSILAREEREWESMETNILAAESKVSVLEATFAAPDFYAKPRAEIFELETQLKTARDKVAHLYARWQELELLQSAPSP